VRRCAVLRRRDLHGIALSSHPRTGRFPLSVWATFTATMTTSTDAIAIPYDSLHPETLRAVVPCRGFVVAGMRRVAHGKT
jgi:hypothetical protein